MDFPEWEKRIWKAVLDNPLSLSMSFVLFRPVLIFEPNPPRIPFLPFLLVLDIKGFCLLWHPPFSIFWRGGQKKGLKVCGGKFLEDISGLCSQGTSCSQCEHGTLSMRSISMTIIFILQQSGSRQHTTTGKKKKKKRSFFQFDTPNTTANI